MWRWRPKLWNYSQLHARPYFLHISWCFDHSATVYIVFLTQLYKNFPPIISPFVSICHRSAAKTRIPCSTSSWRRQRNLRNVPTSTFSSLINRGTAVTKRWPITLAMCCCRSCEDEDFRPLDPLDAASSEQPAQTSCAVIALISLCLAPSNTNLLPVPLKHV